MMRIMMLTQFYPPIIGGTERHVRSLSVDLARRGYDVVVVTLHQDGLPRFEEEYGVRIYRVTGTTQRLSILYSESDRRHAPPFPDPELAWNISKVVAKEQPHIVHAHNWLVHSFLPLKIRSGAKLVMTLHDASLVCAQMRLQYRGEVCSGPNIAKCIDCSADHYGLFKGITTVAANWVMGFAERSAVDMFLPVSHAIATRTGLVGSRLPFKVVFNFIPDNDVESGREDDSYISQLPEEDFLLFVGDLTSDKGTHVLLKAYEGLGSPPPLVLIGRHFEDTPERIPRGVFVMNKWPHSAVMKAWRRSSMGLLPSIFPDACPTVAMEAMASGRPVIGSNIGGIRELVLEGKTGLLVSPGDVASLKRSMQLLINDADLRRRMGESAAKWSNRFRAGTIVPRIEEVYRHVLSAANGDGAAAPEAQ